MGRRKNEPPLPNTAQWQPDQQSSETFKSAFLARCLFIEKLISLRVQFEKEMITHNFDSGPGVEDIIRDEFSRLLPARYAIRAGTIVDQAGSSAGDCDFIAFNDYWCPIVKPAPIAESRRVFYPIDGVYAVGEIKQTLDFDSLDEAMKKLVMCHRLHRAATNQFRPTENRDAPCACFHGLSNPLYSMIIATNLREGIEPRRIVERFVKINQTLSRLEVVRALCILGHGTVTWGCQFQGQVGPALFQWKDLYQPLVAVFHSIEHIQSALYALVANLLLSMNQSILDAEDTANRYGLTRYPTMALEGMEL